jgi:hypothetical protein
MYVEIMMGHQSALDKSYKIPNNEKLREMYLRGEPYLRIYDESAEEIVKTKEEIKETKDRIRDMQLDHLMTKSKMDDIIKQNEKMQRELAILTRAAEVAESK